MKFSLDRVYVKYILRNALKKKKTHMSGVAAHEIIHEVSKKKESRVILKLDYEKAYDRVSWTFLMEMLQSRGFGSLWISWIRNIVEGGSICVRINDENSTFFKPGKGLRQGDPLSPLLFNLVADVFTKMLMNAAKHGLISGLLPQVVDGGIISLQYADDTLLFLENNLEKASAMKWLLVCFEQMSGMKINYDKSDLLTIGMDEDSSNSFAKIFCCKKSEFPIKYLGVPLHYSKLRRVDLQPVIDKVIKRIAGWRGRLLSYAGRLTLLRACLASIPIYLLSVIKFPRWAIDMINSHMGHFLWDNSEEKHRYHLANWPLVAQKKEFGGLGIPDLRSLNIALLSAWIFRYQLNKDTIWTKIVDFKYRTENPNVLCCSSVGTSPFWKGVIWAMQAAKIGIHWKLGDGAKVRFWEDQWVGNTSLAILYWPLCVINEQQGKTVKEVWDGENLRLTFRRSVSEHLMNLWWELVGLMSDINLSKEDDQIVWAYSSSGNYSVQSLYAVVNFGIIPVFVSSVWKLVIPPRVQFFLWLLSKNKLLRSEERRVGWVS
jgi:hypothetical protein